MKPRYFLILSILLTVGCGSREVKKEEDLSSKTTVGQFVTHDAAGDVFLNEECEKFKEAGLIEHYEIMHITRLLVATMRGKKENLDRIPGNRNLHSDLLQWVTYRINADNVSRPWLEFPLWGPDEFTKMLIDAIDKYPEAMKEILGGDEKYPCISFKYWSDRSVFVFLFSKEYASIRKSVVREMLRLHHYQMLGLSNWDYWN